MVLCAGVTFVGAVLMAGAGRAGAQQTAQGAAQGGGAQSNGAAPSPGQPQSQEGMHRISFQFDYDFHTTPACSKKVTKKCVQQFVLYDISAGLDKATKLGTVPLPEHTKGFVKGITATTEPMLFNRGRHMISVVAQMEDGTESDLRRCTTIVKIP